MKYNIPSGAVLFILEGSAVPPGFTRMSLADGKLIRSGSVHGSTGGGSHSHTLDPPSVQSVAKILGVSFTTIAGATVVVPYNHKHTGVNRAQTTSDVQGPVPPYIDVIVAIKN